MLRTIELLLSTVALRPYVFVFFACYLFLAITHIGYRRTVLFTIVAFLVAFLSEWSSAVAGTGFPFGLYRYIDTTRDQELWVCGVPFMDSLSFTFLSYVSWEMAILTLGRGRFRWKDAQLSHGVRRNSLGVTLLASLFMMYLDIVIDPVALLGDRWFLGKIYIYPDGGAYFGVTLMNFVGWFIVCFVILWVYIALESRIGSQRERAGGTASYRYKALGPAVLYFGVLAFNLFMTFWIGERLLGLVGTFLAGVLLTLVTVSICKGNVANVVVESDG